MSFSGLAVGISKVSNGFVVSSFGYSGIQSSFSQKSLGRSRIRNDSLEGYLARIGYDDVPSLTGDPDAFSASLPLSVPITPPMSGTSEIQILIRRRNAYGLESQNQYCQKLTIDTSGDLVDVSISMITGIQAVQIVDDKIRVGMLYSNFGIELYPATHFRLWIDTSPPDVDVDVPTVEEEIVDSAFGTTLDGPYSAGTYYIAACLYRQSDSKQSLPITTTIEVLETPDTPVLQI